MSRVVDSLISELKQVGCLSDAGIVRDVSKTLEMSFEFQGTPKETFVNGFEDGKTLFGLMSYAQMKNEAMDSEDYRGIKHSRYESILDNFSDYIDPARFI